MEFNIGDKIVITDKRHDNKLLDLQERNIGGALIVRDKKKCVGLCNKFIGSTCDRWMYRFEGDEELLHTMNHYCRIFETASLASTLPPKIIRNIKKPKSIKLKRYGI